jgi:hypothetical protein
VSAQKEILFNGTIYRLMGGGRYYLSQSKTNAGRQRAKGLHVAIWEHHHGKTIPAGHLIHHKDGNPLNNDISNLECLSRCEHAKEHHWGANADQMARLRPLTLEWHRSTEGRAWHREHGKRSAAKVQPKEVQCVECGKAYLSKKAGAKFCHYSCRERFYFRTGKTSEKRTCQICAAEFTTRIYSTGKTCSVSCRNRFRAL